MCMCKWIGTAYSHTHAHVHAHVYRYVCIKILTCIVIERPREESFGFFSGLCTFWDFEIWDWIKTKCSTNAVLLYMVSDKSVRHNLVAASWPSTKRSPLKFVNWGLAPYYHPNYFLCMGTEEHQGSRQMILLLPYSIWHLNWLGMSITTTSVTSGLSEFQPIHFSLVKCR